MRIIVHGTEKARQELLQEGLQPGADIKYVTSIADFPEHKGADAFIDLSFENGEKEIALLKELEGLVIINSITDTLAEIHPSFIRINAWPGFLGSIVEASCLKEELKEKTELVFEQFNKKVEWLPDEPGFITPRVISMIINEAYIALEEGISTRAEIDEAMKLGTAYPFGPFEWALNIGIGNIVGLLTRLSDEKSQYKPAALLVQQAAQGNS